MQRWSLACCSDPRTVCAPSPSTSRAVEIFLPVTPLKRFVGCYAYGRRLSLLQSYPHDHLRQWRYQGTGPPFPQTDASALYQPGDFARLLDRLAAPRVRVRLRWWVATNFHRKHRAQLVRVGQMAPSRFLEGCCGQTQQSQPRPATPALPKGQDVARARQDGRASPESLRAHKNTGLWGV